MRERAEGFGDCGKGYRVSACYGMLADVALLARKSEGFGFILGTFGMLTLPTATNEHHQPPPPDLLPQGSRPMPSGGNAAVVRNKKVIRLSVSADIKGGLPFYSSPLPYRFWQKECCRLVRLLSFCFPERVWSIKACNGMEGCRVARRATRRPVMEWNGLIRNACSDKLLKVRFPRSGDWTFPMTGAE